MSAVYLSPHFAEHEFVCNCCGTMCEQGIAPELLDVLEDVREHFGAVPVLINSGYRCPAHNAAVGGATNSQHLLGNAADIDVTHVSPSDVYAYLDDWHEGGLGRYETFTHVDVRSERARWRG